MHTTRNPIEERALTSPDRQNESRNRKRRLRIAAFHRPHDPHHRRRNPRHRPDQRNARAAPPLYKLERMPLVPLPEAEHPCDPRVGCCDRVWVVVGAEDFLECGIV